MQYFIDNDLSHQIKKTTSPNLLQNCHHSHLAVVARFDLVEIDVTRNHFTGALLHKSFPF
jgi:hypothetical protein